MSDLAWTPDGLPIPLVGQQLERCEWRHFAPAPEFVWELVRRRDDVLAAVERTGHVDKPLGVIAASARLYQEACDDATFTARLACARYCDRHPKGRAQAMADLIRYLSTTIERHGRW